VEDYRVERVILGCAGCGRELVTGDVFTAVVLAGEQGFQRADYCPACWKEELATSAFSFFRARVPKPPRKPSRLDLGRVRQFFDGLVEKAEECHAETLYVLALILMRKRKLRLLEESAAEESESGVEGEAKSSILALEDPKDKRVFRVTAPHVSDERLEELNEELLFLLGSSPPLPSDAEGVEERDE
jgi:hypothetical protein